MEKTLENENMSLKNSLVKNTNNATKSNKCNQCDYASSRAGHLREHLKRHSGEKFNKCKQCDFASSYARALRDHLKTYCGENPQKMQLVWLCILNWHNIPANRQIRSDTNIKFISWDRSSLCYGVLLYIMIPTNFLNFHSAYWCNWCHKSHS